jgi:hypothetical protein
VEIVYKVALKSHASPTGGQYVPPTVQFELQGTPAAGDYIELAWLDQHFNCLVWAGDTPATALARLSATIADNQATGLVSAAANGNRITLTYLGMPGHNGNRVGVYGTVHGASTESWAPSSAVFSGGMSPERWKVELDFGDLHDELGRLVPTSKVRKLRWTWAADLQPRNFERSEFSVVVSNWTVSGSGLQYQVAGAGSRRIEDDAPEVVYTGTWHEARGNYSGGSIRWTTAVGASLQCTYAGGAAHSLYLGTRKAESCGLVSVQVDANAAVSFDLSLAAEDVLLRVPLGRQAAGQHTITLTRSGTGESYLYFDFLEIAYPAADLPTFHTLATTTLATDWDTDHSIALAPERTAWLIHTLGFQGRANHYAGALWFYELCRPGHQYASGSITFTGSPEFGQPTQISLGPTLISHLNLIGDTAASVAKCFELLVNAGSTGVWAQANGASLTITSRTMGTAGNGLVISANTSSGQFTAQPSNSALANGGDIGMSNSRAEHLSGAGVWQTDLNSTPRVNRAARDWCRSFFVALKSCGIEVASAFSMELQHGDDSVAAGISQRYPNGDAVWLNTPAVQTNFGPASSAFWRQVYLDMAQVMIDAGVAPYLQFGEVQWWYFAAVSGMPFYDDYTRASFETSHGHVMAVIPNQNADPAGFPQECVHLPQLIGVFTTTIMAFVRQSHPETRFEVLYPPDVNDTPLNRIVNFPASHWTPASLSCLKTENFTYTGNRNLDKARESIVLPMQFGFPRSQSSHLVGIGEHTTPWEKEQRMAQGEGVESVVLFALDQFCLLGYRLPLSRGPRRSQFQGG